MLEQLNASASPTGSPDGAPALPAAQVAILATFIDFPELAKRIPMCERSLREAIRRGRIPSIRLPGARRVMFHWPTVQETLLRLQRGVE